MEDNVLSVSSRRSNPRSGGAKVTSLRSSGHRTTLHPLALCWVDHQNSQAGFDWCGPVPVLTKEKDMSNTYDINVKFDIATSGGLNKKEKRKEIKHNRKQFQIWVAKQLEHFDNAENNMDDYFEFSEDCVPFDIKLHGIDHINHE